ncbi:hypothetical protein F5Y15DRAFT_430328 [Xylariaceae sp. FL0016]|nr:hypothetical protein F5Y15DRAFT_430328 [Xylariaceae sp. FL0016]
MAGRKNMSLESALEEERKEIENLMTMRSAPTRRAPSAGPRSPSPFMSPRSPVRSMLDIDDAPKSTPAQAPVRSMLDVVDTTATPSSTHTSPTLSFKQPVINNTTRHRSMSDAASNAAPDLGPRSPTTPKSADPTSAYKFSDIFPTNIGQALPTRRGTSAQTRAASIGEALRGDLSNLALPGDSGRGFFKKNKSKSPSGRLGLRSSSPFGNPSRRQQSQGTFMLDNGQVVDMNSAYRRLSDASLAYGGGSLASLSKKKRQDYSDGHGRIEKDNLSPYGELLPDESEDEAALSSDDENQRGRKLTTRAESEAQEGTTDGRAKSLLAAVEDERRSVATQYKYRSLFDEPEIKVTSPSGEKAKQHKASKQAVQPETSFDQEPVSGNQTPYDPDRDADETDIRVAQNLQLSLTPIISTPETHRTVRLMYRGDYHRIQKEAEEEHRRLRKYLVATDLSDESTHALEWAIGTILRDGDTLIAMYCMDEETSGSVDANSLVPDEPKAMKEQAAHVNAMAKVTNVKPNSGSPSPFNFNRSSNSPLIRAADTGSNASSPAPGSRARGRLEEERYRAVRDITERVSRLLRKTQLQVRVIVEIIHCKSPKHLITEVIDLLSPTLVILGSRGRSALKGSVLNVVISNLKTLAYTQYSTLLGSFSNYLVTKSSVPVMVARKKLKKKSKYQPPPSKQVNNLSNPSARSLEQARID